MRTTVDLDDDLDIRVRELARRRGITFRAVVHDLLRAGLEPRSVAPVAYELPAWDLGVRPGFDVDKALSLSAELEDDETLRKIALRK